MLYEHQNSVSTLKADAELGLKLAGEEAAKREGQLQKDFRNLKLEIKEQVRTTVYSNAMHCNTFIICTSCFVLSS